MSETLGSLIDKLSIKCIREYFLREMERGKTGPLSGGEIRERLEALQKQKENMLAEIDAFVASAVSGGILLRDEKLKLYNKPEHVGRIKASDSIAEAISGLMKKNLELWQLEDEARREDAPLSYIGEIKRKIDPANQQRNDYIDRIDELLERKIDDKDGRAGDMQSEE